MMVRDFHRVIGVEAAGRFWSVKTACRICSSPAWAAAATRLAFSIPSE